MSCAGRGSTVMFVITHSPMLKSCQSNLSFLLQHKPVALYLARELEKQYHNVKPWLESYQLELSTAFQIGRDAHAKLRQRLTSKEDVIFEDASRAHLVS